MRWSWLAMAAGITVPAAGRAEGITIAPQVSTLGLGGELGARLSDSLGVRVQGNALSLSPGRRMDGVPYKADVDLRSGGVVVDWYPSGGVFHLSAGVRLNGNGVGLDASPSQPVELGGTTYTPDRLGRLTGSVTFAPVAPYLGLGWQAGLMEGRLSVGIDVGVLFQGRPDVDLAASGPAAADPAFQRDLDAHRRVVADDLEVMRFFPVVALTITYKF